MINRISYYSLLNIFGFLSDDDLLNTYDALKRVINFNRYISNNKISYFEKNIHIRNKVFENLSKDKILKGVIKSNILIEKKLIKIISSHRMILNKKDKNFFIDNNCCSNRSQFYLKLYFYLFNNAFFLLSLFWQYNHDGNNQVENFITVFTSFFNLLLIINAIDNKLLKYDRERTKVILDKAEYYLNQYKSMHLKNEKECSSITEISISVDDDLKNNNNYRSGNY